jgi:hypothetical protein
MSIKGAIAYAHSNARRSGTADSPKTSDAEEPRLTGFSREDLCAHLFKLRKSSIESADNSIVARV